MVVTVYNEQISCERDCDPNGIGKLSLSRALRAQHANTRAIGTNSLHPVIDPLCHQNLAQGGHPQTIRKTELPWSSSFGTQHAEKCPIRSKHLQTMVAIVSHEHLSTIHRHAARTL